MNESVLADVIRPGAGRGLDFVNLDELRKRTGITIGEVLKFAMSEMLCNSLDTSLPKIILHSRFLSLPSSPSLRSLNNIGDT